MKEKEAGKNLSPDELTWKEFMKEPTDIAKLSQMAFDEDYKTFFRLRALEICLAPDIRDLDYKVNLCRVDGNSFCLLKQFDMRNLIEDEASQDQILFLADRLPKYIRKTEQEAKTVIDPKKVKFLLEKANYYNYLIPVILPKLSIIDGEKLFEAFDIRDKKTNLESFYGSEYNPIYHLLESIDVDEHWKGQALEKINKIFEQKIKKGDQVDCQFLLDILSERNSPFLENEVNFLLKIIPEDSVAHLISTKKIYEKINEPDVGRRFLRRQINSMRDMNRGVSSRSDVFDDTFIKKILEVFSDDQEMVDYIKNSQKRTEERRQSLVDLDQIKKTEIKEAMRRDIVRRMKN